MLIGHPLPLGCVGMASTNVLGLQMLQLTVDVVSIIHSAKQWESKFNNIFWIFDVT